jgi:ferrous-iron efflux pump FieF
LDIRARRLVWIAGVSSVALALALIALKAWAWLATDSVAMLGSLVDSALDLVSSGITLVAIHWALTPPDAEHRFGHGKSEGIAGLLQSVIILGSGSFIAVRALQRIVEPSAVLEPGLGSAVIAVSLALTGALVLLQRYVLSHADSLAVAADMMHYKMDLLSNLGVVAALVLSAQFGLHILDPIFGLLIAAYIVYSVRDILVRTFHVLMDHELPTADRQRIEAIAFAHPQVRGVHDIRTRSSGSAQFVQLHIELPPDMPLTEVSLVSEEIERQIRTGFPQAEVLIHADPAGPGEPRDPP